MRRHDTYGFGSQQRQARRRGNWQGSLRLGVLFAVLVGINLYVFFFRGGTSIQDILRASAMSKQKAAQAGQAGSRSDALGPGAEAKDGSLVVQGSLKGYVTLTSALLATKLDATQVNELVQALGPVLNMRALKPEEQFTLYLDPGSGKLRRFVYHLTPISAVVATRDESGLLTAVKSERKLDIRKVKLGGKVVSSLDQAILARGEAYSLVSNFVQLLSWDINWYADPREDDEFRLIVEKKYLENKFYGYGRILAAEYRGIIGRRQVFYYVNRTGTGSYCTPEGRLVNRTFLKMPLNFRRISSQFDQRRFHPVLHVTKGHFGVDYAADPGTPVWATSDGVVLKSGRFGGAGLMVELGHANQVQTVYMHFSRIARGIEPGVKVRQRQIIGYVGSTGLSTGPHLHYGVHADGKPVDPLKFTVGKGALLPKDERMHFLHLLAERQAELESIPAR